MKVKLLSWLLYALFNWYDVKSRILTVVGDIRFSIWPMWFLYVPVDYAIKGKDIQEVLSKIKPGDIILRGYDKRWLDGLFIPTTHGYSHAGIYVGDNTVVHAVAEGVSKIHLIDFCQADKIVVFRSKTGVENAIKRALKFIGIKYDFSFKPGDQTLYCFQLAAQCYRELKFERYPLSLICFKLPIWCGACYLDGSFFNNDNLEKVGEI